MPEIFFWNVNRQDRRDLVCEAAKALPADVIVLVESGISADAMLASLQSSVSGNFVSPYASTGRFQVFIRDSQFDLSEIYGEDRVSIRRFALPHAELVFAVVHIVDRLNWDKPHQSGQVQLLAEKIRQIEEEFSNEATIVLGDLNMNPFESSMNLATGMNAMMTKRCVQRKSRQLQNTKYPFFYNPMWNLFGDETPGPAGTFYHAKSTRGRYGWNMLDQVLLRPSAIKWFDGVKILTELGEYSLATPSGRPDKKNASDHFPIQVSIK